MSEPSDNDEAEPDFAVWNHLESGWQMAYDDASWKLTPAMVEFYQSLAGLIVSAKSQLRIDWSRSDIRERLKKLSVTIPEGDSGKFLRGLMKWYATGSDKWLSHFVHLEVAGQGIGRATMALERIDLLAAHLGGTQPMPEKSLSYLREVIDAFLFGFDAAAIALARGTLEQLAREVLVRIGALTEAQLRRERPDLEELLSRLRQSGVLSNASGAANRLRERGNTVLHQHLYDDRVRQQMALASIGDLGQVLREIVP